MPPPGGGMGPPGSGGGPGAMPPSMQPPSLPAACKDMKIRPGTAPLRRLTRFEYNNTIRDLLGDTTSPANNLPAEDLGNGFGNDASTQSVSSLLAEQYAAVAEGIAARATKDAAALGMLAPCAASASAAAEEGCARTIIDGFTPKAYRRPLAAGEADGLLALFRSTRMLAGQTFATSIAAVIEAILQTPDFLYRVEFGAPDRMMTTLRRPTGDEMATRLSYLLWGSLPDDGLRAAARSGELLTGPGVLAQATRMLNDPRAKKMVRFFFDNLLPLTGLSDLERDKMLFPTFNATVGGLMGEETQRLLEYEIFDPAGGGTWASALTAPYTFLNSALAAYYKLPAVSGTAFQKVNVDPTKRLGFITHGSVMAGTTHSNHTNPVVRGSFIVQKLLCLKIPLPDASIAEKVKAPDPYSGKTARERFTKHQEDPICKSCHVAMDPVGLTLENYDPVGQYRTHENNVLIDASGSLPGSDDKLNGAPDLARAMAKVTDTHNCFATQWMQLAFGRTASPADECLQAALNIAFHKAGYNVKQLLLALTQTDAFLYYGGSQ